MSNMRLLFLFILLFSFIYTHAQPTGFIHVSNGNIVDGQEKPVVLHGVNLGGWLLWEGWIWGSGFTSETKIDSKLTELYGKEEADKFRWSVYNNMITEEDIKAISGLCMNVVRVPFNHTLLEDDSNPYVYKEEGFRLLDRLLGWCEKYNVYVILDLHSAPGGQSKFFIADPDKIRLWDSPGNQKRTYALWKAIAARYKDRTIIAGYDLLNEPLAPKDEQLKAFYRNAIDTIRKVDTNHMIILEGTKFATAFDVFDKAMDSNQIFSFHLYTWLVKDIRAKTDKLDAFAKKVGVPLWCGEWGENKIAELKETNDLFYKNNYRFCGTAMWTWKKFFIPNRHPAINTIPAGDEWLHVMKWISGVKPMPDPQTAQKGKEQFLEAIKYKSSNADAEMYHLLKQCSK
jgi:endoglucanase